MLSFLIDRILSDPLWGCSALGSHYETMVEARAAVQRLTRRDCKQRLSRKCYWRPVWGQRQRFVLAAMGSFYERAHNASTRVLPRAKVGLVTCSVCPRPALGHPAECQRKEITPWHRGRCDSDSLSGVRCQ
ncbi:hypothetical protein J6590_105304 [Homalodisca vitripennis]|nr:hypothetical protein J6590_019343 [Homalodisca vitripennis]KAG8274550.1 hypothetical protein J6590_105304 [Homalodisca vitripennis]